jgi:hypothetical protein
MEEQELPSTRSIGIKYGVISALIGIITVVIIDFAGLVGNSAVQWGGTLITLVILFLAHKEFKDQGDGFMEYKEGLGIGVWFALIGSVISSAFMGIYTSFINPQYSANLLELQRIEMEEQGTMSDAQIEQALEITSKFVSPLGITITSLIFGFIITFIIALILSAITKKSRPEMI